MNINPVGDGNYYIEIGGDELCDVSVESLIGDDASGLPEGAVYEVFGGDEGALVFARARRGAPSFYRFASLETLIAAACATANTSAGAAITYLVRLGDGYCLIFYPWNSEAPPTALGEFGEAMEASPSYARHVTEHGHVIMAPTALGELVQWFG